MIQAAIDNSTRGSVVSNLRSTLKPILNTVAACVTLGTGNSLGPEGPSVEIGVSVAKGVGTLIGNGGQRKLSLRAAGSAAGLSSGFNAAVAGCFFAVESVLWPSLMESSSSLTNTTSMVILSAVIASVMSEVGLALSQLLQFQSTTSVLQVVLKVSKLCSSSAERCRVTWKVTPNTSLLTALTLMNKHKLSQIPVIMEHVDSGGCPVGLLDRESIDLAKRNNSIFIQKPKIVLEM
ncbi:chloride channel protein CLC-e-like [Primulina huaijiensis]|uniref:chloride channel protein CLC-e-like n=1 Tax=Primulina huaijiensis TaxID=1492673 RepID=UPI003CC74907